MNIETRLLKGPALDWAVAQALGIEVSVFGHGVELHIGHQLYTPWSPTTNWYQGGPIVEGKKIDIEWVTDTTVKAELLGSVSGFGSTPLVAACRAVVIEALGVEIHVPECLR